MKFGLLKERKVPVDKRVIFSPTMLLEVKRQFPDAQIVIESSDVRIFKDEEYIAAGFNVTNNLSDCDVLLGVKEIPVNALIANKSYFFFSHTIKKQAHNQKLLQAIIDKNITLYDHEVVVDANKKRLIGFGRYAGIVGTYNAFRAFGQKFELFNVPKAETLEYKEALAERLKRPVMPPVKIVVTGKGKVGMGAKELLDAVRIKEVSVENFLTKIYDSPVYTQIDVLDYNKRIDGTVPESCTDFFKNPEQYVSDFERFANTADIYVAGHFYANEAPKILTRDMLRSKHNKIKVVADVSCDVNAAVDSTLRTSTIAEPFYGYNPSTGEEVDMHHPAAIVVMAVDNLPCELPRDSSEGFGEMFLKHVIPAFFNVDKDDILKKATIVKDGRLTERFNYLSDYINTNVPQ